MVTSTSAEVRVFLTFSLWWQRQHLERRSVIALTKPFFLGQQAHTEAQNLQSHCLCQSGLFQWF